MGQTPCSSAGEVMEASVNPKDEFCQHLQIRKVESAGAGVSVEMPPPQSCVLCSPFFWYGSVLSNLLFPLNIL